MFSARMRPVACNKDTCSVPTGLGLKYRRMVVLASSIVRSFLNMLSLAYGVEDLDLDNFAFFKAFAVFWDDHVAVASGQC